MKLKRRATTAGCLLALLVGTPALGQALFIAPSLTVTDQIDLLTGVQRSSRLSVEAHALIDFDTNVEDFARAGIRHPAPTRFSGDVGYYTSDQTQEIAIARGAWQLSYASVSAELYRGNHDAAQLYLDSVSRTINTNAVYNPNMILNRTHATRLRVDYSAPARIKGVRAQILVAGNLLRFSRAQLGSLQGTTVNGQFHGDIDLDTTLGLPAGQVSSYGASLDTGISLAIQRHVRVSAAVENLLGQVWQSKVQHIFTSVTTNTLQPNSDGFLQGVPLLSGSVTDQSLQSSIRRRYHFGAAYRESNLDWLALLSYDFDWRANLGVSARLAHSQRLWALLCPAPFEWQLGYDYSGLTLQLGLSSIDLGTSQRATLLVGYRQFL